MYSLKLIALLTTSREPSYRTRSFIKDFSSVLPGVIRTHRGKKTLLELALEAKRFGAKYIIIVGEKKGNPSIIRIYRLIPYSSTEIQEQLMKHIVTLILSGVKLSREMPEVFRTYNPSTISIDPSMCSSEECFMISDVFIKIFSEVLNPNPDVTLLVIEDREGIRVEFRNRARRPCGPVLRIKKVKIFGE